MPEPTAPLFSAPGSAPTDRADRGFPRVAVGIAAAVVACLLLGVLLFSGRHKVGSLNQPLPLDPYAAHLPLGSLAMSESTSLSGGKSTFLDGAITNDGPAFVTGVTVQVFFRNDENLPPHLETLPLSLIRTREPYVDTQPVAAAPLAPGATRPFRLIFESIPANWNTQMPELRIVRVEHR